MTRGPSLIEVRTGAATDTGLRRAINEDSFLAASPLFLVADGMGGHDAGEVASRAVIDVFAAHAGAASLSVDEVRSALDSARRAVAELSAEADSGAGTTLTGAVVADVGGEGYWLVFNIGDSRTYLHSRGVLDQVSVDHSVVQELVDSGELDAEAAAADRRRNVITRAIGGGGDSDADFWLLPAEQGDRLLVCSDGLPGELERGEIEAILHAERSPQAAAERLVSAARAHGGRDNITAVVVDALSVRSRLSDVELSVGAVFGGLDDDTFEADTRPLVRAGSRR